MLHRWFPIFLYSGLVFAATAPTFPVLTYSTYLRDSFTPNAITTDASGNIYMAGNAIVDPSTSQTAVLVVKLNPQASQYLYARYLGGSVNDYANAIVVDGAGNAYVAGSTASPDFPVTSGGNLGTAPTGQSSQRSFVAKLDPNGELVFSDLLGGSAASTAQAVAVTSAGQILVSGSCGLGAGSCSSGFPSTAGAYSIANSANHPYLLELDPTGMKTIFSATGIGGSAIALDSSGNIYVAGTTYLLDYPTTPGAYQTTFAAVNGCPQGSPCFTVIQGANQYVTKVDPTGSKLIFSTAVSGSGNTTNTGLAVNTAGDVYLTGLAGATYPYTVTPPVIPTGPAASIGALPFLSKLDPAGQTLLFSVPLGGAGVQVDSNGSAYVSGTLGVLGSPGYAVTASIPALASVPVQCLPNTLILKSSYVSQVDADSGNVLGSQFIGGSTLTISAVALFGSTLWIAGATNLPDFPISPNALTLPNFGPNPLPGAYVGAVDFSQPKPPAGTPQIGCIVNAGNLATAGPVARYQLLTIFGTGLGPATGVSATNNSTTSLAGVDISFNFGVTPTVLAPLLYVSSTQINLAVPLVPIIQSLTVMQLTVNGVTAPPRQLPFTYANPSLFLNTTQTFQTNSPGFVAVALNADGSMNSSSNPAQLGSAISVFVNGLTPDPQIVSAPLQLYTNNGWSVTNIAQANPFVLQVDLQIPSMLVTNFSCAPPSSLCTVGFTLYDVSGGSVGQAVSSGAESFGALVYVTQ